MTAIKEYPFDLSDLQKQEAAGEGPPADSQPSQPQPAQTLKQTPVNTKAPTPEVGKRKVSIMADEGSKDRENLPDRYFSFYCFSLVASNVLVNVYFFNEWYVVIFVSISFGYYGKNRYTYLFV